ncbi:hypothetical protein A6A03_00545 [Chloroflexus islandicus]|uniref:Card1 endonuclease domain-containing protein n=1 Tax=Chloroflexus islandicus TaxID=1707952 RepID=A0A178MEV4_9CHLR|nr:DUF1887 family CARF protein [Chloroflexus islandicus]OAN47269.1 hypothetical protein A6A03_00545 [Chloroflexus islandicus]
MTQQPTALLILIGGRQTPNILSAQHLRPQVIAPIASHEALRPGQAWEMVYPALKNIGSTILPPAAVDAFDLDQIKQACANVIASHPEMRWVCNVTCATTIMSIGAYEVGRDKGADVWYFDTNSRRVIVLAGQPPQGDPYRLSVTDYLRIYQRKANPAPPPPQSWLELSRQMAQAPDEAIEFREQLRKVEANASYSGPRWLKGISLTRAMQNWLPLLSDAGFIDQYQRQHGAYNLHQVHQDLWKFVDGLWLEIVAWDAARQAGCFDDCQYGLEMPIAGQAAMNQLDLAATSAASLLIAECKTDQSPFRTIYLDKLQSITDLIGGSFVVKLFIAARSSQNANPDAWRSFSDQAKARQIVVVTGEQLPNLKDILAKEAKRPTYSRT